MLERKELFLVPKMPFSNQLASVSNLAQNFWDKNLFILNTAHNILRGVSIPPWVCALVETIAQWKATCQQGGSRRRTDCCAGIKLGKQNALRCHSIKVWRFSCWMAHHPKVPPAKIIHVHDYKVWLIIFCTADL
jgi:hypothetical protein